MESNIRAGMRVLYKQGNSNWMIGTIMRGSAEINEQGLWIPILPKDTNEEVHYAEISQIFFDATKLDNWMKDRLIPKANYIEYIKGEDFDRHTESAWVSDGEYYYYPISKFNEIWINKQPFNFVIRSD
jgi:hypothetical protein